MSEYQYYEFRALDRPLNEREMDEVRELSTRAEITPTSFTNEYQWGNFRGNPRKMMEKYYDAFVYYANWGTTRLMLRLPKQSVDLKAMKAYAAGDSLSLHTKGSSVIVEFTSQREGEWVEPIDWMDTLIPIRDSLLSGDLRSLYLGWLVALQAGELDENQQEPPVPPGLRRLSTPLSRLADFLWIDDALLKAASKADTGKPPAKPKRKEISAWVASRPESEKNALLYRVLAGEATKVAQQLLRQFHLASRKISSTKTRWQPLPPRTVAQLLKMWQGPQS